MENNPVYADVTWSRTDDNRPIIDLLPIDDVPNEILETLEITKMKTMRDTAHWDIYGSLPMTFVFCRSTFCVIS